MAPPKRKRLPKTVSTSFSAPTISDLMEDDIFKVAKVNWDQSLPKKKLSAALVVSLYEQNVFAFDLSKIIKLEYSGYLENYLWPLFNAKSASYEHVMSIAAMVNEKIRDGNVAWALFRDSQKKFSAFFQRITELALPQPKRLPKGHKASRSFLVTAPKDKQMTMRERAVFLTFLLHASLALEEDFVKESVLRFCGLPLWTQIADNRRNRELAAAPTMARHWRQLSSGKKGALKDTAPEGRFLAGVVDSLLALIEAQAPDAATPAPDRDTCSAIEHGVSLVTELLAQLPTRRFFRPLLADRHFTVRCDACALKTVPEGVLFAKLLRMLIEYETFNINEQAGVALSDDEIDEAFFKRNEELQKILFAFFDDRLQELALGPQSVAHDELASLLGRLSPAELRRAAFALCLVGSQTPGGSAPADDGEAAFDAERSRLSELIIRHMQRQTSQVRQVNKLALFPTERKMWDTDLVPEEHHSGVECLALPRLNLQFLTTQDYLNRNFVLFMLEDIYQVRQDVEKVLMHMDPRQATAQIASGAPGETVTRPTGETIWGGWSRYALPLIDFTVLEVLAPNVGETVPARVTCEAKFTMAGLPDHIRREWEAVRQYDVMYVLQVRCERTESAKQAWREAQKAGRGKGDKESSVGKFCDMFGLKSFRGFEIDEIRDEKNTVIHDFSEHKAVGNRRTLRGLMDSNQYFEDTGSITDDGAEAYNFNLLMRRRPEQNNGKAVLETIRDLINSRFEMPDWLEDILLGYGVASSAHYRALLGRKEHAAAEAGKQGEAAGSAVEVSVDFNDTFLDEEHLRASFGDVPLEVVPHEDGSNAPPYRLTFTEDTAALATARVQATAVRRPARGPYPFLLPKQNGVRFSPRQVDAIKSGCLPGLTLVVGPPGTGKTDVAVQIVSNIYHSYPEERTLLVTHSNAALNQLFEKIAELDIDPRHLVRLGHGEESLATEEDYTKAGRVDYMLAKRLEQLEEAGRLAKTLGIDPGMISTCETAANVFLVQVLPKWNKFLAQVRDDAPETVSDKFPFTEFFANAPQPLFTGVSFQADLRIAQSCFRYIRTVFATLDDCRPYELLRKGFDRGNFMLTKQARIVAMTCTHAALKRTDLVKMGFRYHNLIMEEAAQILEIETFIPMVLQSGREGTNLRRAVLIGDHNQLPPVVQNMAFQRYSHLEQSMFARLVRLQVPFYELDKQGRCRPELRELFSWRYKSLGDLSHIAADAEFSRAVSGFAHPMQFVDVRPSEAFGGGESTPQPYFYQNLGEAEFVVATYMYMRLLGYPADRIAILTTYNGQRQLIRDVVAQRCGRNRLFGYPASISTVDKYQGLQNDYVLLSLVRTRAVGHIRDVRRLVVALSRARLGLFVFGSWSLFRNCPELAPALARFEKYPQTLSILSDPEAYGTERSAADAVSADSVTAYASASELGRTVFQLAQTQLERRGERDRQAAQKRRLEEEEEQQEQADGTEREQDQVGESEQPKAKRQKTEDAAEEKPEDEDKHNTS